VCGDYDAYRDGDETVNATEPIVTAECGLEVAPTCLTYAEGVEDWDADICVVVAETATNTTCSCRAAPTADYASSSSGNAYLNYYKEAFSDPNPMSLAEGATTLNTFFGVIGGFWFLCGLVGVWLDRRDARRAAEAPEDGDDGVPALPGLDHTSMLTAALPKQLRKSRQLQNRLIGAPKATTWTKLREWAKLCAKEHEWLAAVFVVSRRFFFVPAVSRVARVGLRAGRAALDPVLPQLCGHDHHPLRRRRRPLVLVPRGDVRDGGF
jgi:hypothetical protein